MTARLPHPNGRTSTRRIAAGAAATFLCAAIAQACSEGLGPRPPAVWTTIAAGLDHSCGVTNRDAAYCWGRNAYGQLGDTSTADRTIPVTVGTGYVSVTVGRYHSCALTSAGKAYCWGWNGDGQLGDRTTTPRKVPVAVSGGLSFASLSAGAAHTCGITAGGAAYCWGRNACGQLGDGSTTDRPAP